MSTFLALVKDLARESGTLSASLVTTVLTPTNERLDKMIRWVQKGWVNIQNEQRDWLWMRAETLQTLTINTTRYLGPGTTPNFGLTRWGDWVTDSDDLLPVSLYDNSIGVADEGPLRQIDYSLWYTKYVRGTQTAHRPIEWAVSPAGELCVGPKPDKAYKLRLIYQKSPQSLSADLDEPEMPSRFHDLITWEALKLLLIHDGQFQEKMFETFDLMELRNQLHREQLPEMISDRGGYLDAVR